MKANHRRASGHPASHTGCSGGRKAPSRRTGQEKGPQYHRQHIKKCEQKEKCNKANDARKRETNSYDLMCYLTLQEIIFT